MTPTTLIGTVADVFTIARRGVGVLFTVSPEHIATRGRLVILVARPDGTSTSFVAHREFARTARWATSEVVALVISDATPEDVPVGSLVTETIVNVREG